MPLSLPLCHQCVCDCEGRRRTQPATQRPAGVQKSAANAKSAHEHLPRRPPPHRLASTWRTLFPHISSPDSVTHTHPECVVNARRVVDIRSAVHHIHSKEGRGGGDQTQKRGGAHAHAPWRPQHAHQGIRQTRGTPRSPRCLRNGFARPAGKRSAAIRATCGRGRVGAVSEFRDRAFNKSVNI